jgi:hypothetical protein
MNYTKLIAGFFAEQRRMLFYKERDGFEVMMDQAREYIRSVEGSLDYRKKDFISYNEFRAQYQGSVLYDRLLTNTAMVNEAAINAAIDIINYIDEKKSNKCPKCHHIINGTDTVEKFKKALKERDAETAYDIMDEYEMISEVICGIMRSFVTDFGDYICIGQIVIKQPKNCTES